MFLMFASHTENTESNSKNYSKYLYFFLIINLEAMHFFPEEISFEKCFNFQMTHCQHLHFKKNVLNNTIWILWLYIV